MSSRNNSIADVAERYPDLLRDESRYTGKADAVSFPVTEEDLAEQLRAAARNGTRVTLQGARTGITGGAVPNGGHVLNLSRMCRVLGLRRDAEGPFFLRLQPGVVLSDLRRALACGEFDTAGWSAASQACLGTFRESVSCFFPPDPTETTASIGGMVSCNASGARSFAYGPTRRYVEAIRVVLADGSRLALRRGRERASGRDFSVITEEGTRLSGRLPSYRMPDVKNAAGYFVRDDMDLADLFIGSEGTLGAVSEIEIRLLPAPCAVWGVMAFLPDEEAAIAFVEEVRLRERPAAVEFFDCRSLNLLRTRKAANPAFQELPELRADWHTGIYLEYHGDDEEAVEQAVTGMSEILTGCGGSEEATWLLSDERALERLREFRHAIPEAVNMRIDEKRKRDPGLTKLGTDLSVPDASLRRILALYHGDLDGTGLEYVMFGHIGDNHVHVNIIPDDAGEYEKGKALYLNWARVAVRMGGSVSAEHGIGKLKTAFLREMYGDSGIREMVRVKRVLDPQGRLNAGNLFGEEAGEIV